ncbi:porphobilinogen synthase [Desulfonatronovibrio magnus]|uniref:porphobilinogen synthase n=1 Tax=Desulfonatronovibrio magnus TaxID=698827 RepID=UPI0005EB765D|nr:porphobilinogen synthase [Desulfonatronovibrio magnus]
MSFYRGRRLRKTPAIRKMVRETAVAPQDLIQPFFVSEEDDDLERPIESMPGQYQLGVDKLLEHVEDVVEKGISSVILFGVPNEKDEAASQAFAEDGIVQKAVSRLKRSFPELIVITDVCLCEYMSHGHCGIIKNGHVVNDATLDILVRTAVSHARAGADIVAPSDMMDGRIKHIRQALDTEGYTDLPIMSYAVKYASAFYGPFRDAAQSAPSFGDRKSYQMDPANSKEAMREAAADVAEGADMLMVKPAMPYLDIIRDLKQNFDLPLAAYHVSGEYALIKSAAEAGRIDERKIVMESITCIKRAGADIILTYYAADIARWLEQES